MRPQPPAAVWQQRTVLTCPYADFCKGSLWEEPFCPWRYESRWSDRSRLCPSAAFFHRSRAASRCGLGLVGDSGRLISPISTFFSASLLFLGDFLSPQAFAEAIDKRRPWAGEMTR